MRPDYRTAILRLLRLRDEQKGGPLPELTDLVDAIGQSLLEMRRACDALETDGFITGAHGMSGDENPSYYISDMGKAYLYDLEHE